MAKGDWSASYVVPSVALSTAAAGFLAWHTIKPEAKVDGWSVTLLVIFFLPWLRTVFESIDFPGGGSVKFRQEVKAEQERQAKEIEAMRFLLARYLSKPERELLQRLANGDEVSITADSNNKLFQHASSLGRMGMVAKRPGLLENYHQLAAEGHESMEAILLGDMVSITDSGRKYLDLISALPDEIE